jgi:hypothetical protein
MSKGTKNSEKNKKTVEKPVLFETKSEKFIRLAEGRTSSILKNLKLLSNLSRSKNYAYTPEQVNKIFRSIKEEINLSEASFKKNNKSLFKL